MIEEVITSPSVYRGGAWHTKQAFSRSLHALPLSIFVFSVSLFDTLTAETCSAGMCGSWGMVFGGTLGIFISQLKWTNLKEPFLDLSLVKIAKWLAFVSIVFLAVSLLSSNVPLFHGAAFITVFTIYFCAFSLLPWAVNRYWHR